MAERVVLAELVVDDRGVVQSVKTATEKISLFGRETKNTADVVTARMFNMRSAAVAFLGAFTFAGAIYELKALVTAVFQASDAWDKYSKSATAAGHSTANLLADLTGITDVLESTSAWMDRIGALARAGKAVGYEGPTPLGVLGNWLFGGQLTTIQTALGWIGEWLDKRLGTGAYAGVAPIIDKDAVAQWEAAVKALEQSGAYGATARQTQLGENFRRMGGSIVGVTPAQRIPDSAGFGEFLRDTTFYLTEWDNAIGGATETAAAFNDQLSNIVETNLDLNESTTYFEDVFDADKFSAIAAALQGVGLALSEMISVGGNARDMFSGMLRSLSAAMFVKSAEYVAYAIAASTGIGSLTLQGTPAQFLKAAAKFAAVGTLAGVGARATGGGGASNASYAQALPQPGSGAVTPQVTIILQGELSDVSLRKITGGVLKSINDGVGGGQLAVVGA